MLLLLVIHVQLIEWVVQTTTRSSSFCTWLAALSSCWLCWSAVACRHHRRCRRCNRRRHRVLHRSCCRFNFAFIRRNSPLEWLQNCDDDKKNDYVGDKHNTRQLDIHESWQIPKRNSKRCHCNQISYHHHQIAVSSNFSAGCCLLTTQNPSDKPKTTMQPIENATSRMTGATSKSGIEELKPNESASN